MQPVDVVIGWLTKEPSGWFNDDDREVAEALSKMLIEVAKRSARHFPPDTRFCWTDQLRLIEGDVLHWLVPFMVSTVSDAGIHKQAIEKIERRLEMYRAMAREDHEREVARR